MAVLGCEPKQSNCRAEFLRGEGTGWDLSPSRSRHRTVRQGPAKDRGLGKTAAQQSTLSSTDRTRTQRPPSVGKTVTSYPPTRGENSLESIKGAELPRRFISGLWAGKTKQGKAGEAGCRDKARQPPAEGPRRCQHTLKGVPLAQVNRWAGQWPLVCCDDEQQIGKGRGGGVAASPALPRIPRVISGEPLPVLGLDPLSEQKRNWDPSPLCLRSLGRRCKQTGLQINTRRSRPAS